MIRFTATMLTALLAMTSHAAAEPFSLSVFLFNATFLGSFLSFSAVYTIASLLPAISADDLKAGGEQLADEYDAVRGEVATGQRDRHSASVSDGNARQPRS